MLIRDNHGVVAHRQVVFKFFLQCIKAQANLQKVISTGFSAILCVIFDFISCSRVNDATTGKPDC